MPIKPLRDFLAIVADELLPETTLIVKAGKGIVESQKQFSRRGRVVAAGPGRLDKAGNLHPCQAKIGDIVRYGEWKYTDLVDPDGGPMITIISDQDVIGIETVGSFRQESVEHV